VDAIRVEGVKWSAAGARVLVGSRGMFRDVQETLIISLRKRFWRGMTRWVARDGAPTTSASPNVADAAQQIASALHDVSELHAALCVRLSEFERALGKEPGEHLIERVRAVNFHWGLLVARLEILEAIAGPAVAALVWTSEPMRETRAAAAGAGKKVFSARLRLPPGPCLFWPELLWWSHRLTDRIASEMPDWKQRRTLHVS
jgi:hypothetical protein